MAGPVGPEPWPDPYSTYIARPLLVEENGFRPGRETVSPPPDADPVVRPPARLTLFGFDPTDAVVTLRRRTRAWRITRTLRILAVTALAAPVAGLVPPHAPWAVGALGAGLFLAYRRWNHRFSVLELAARCPRCGDDVGLEPGTPLRTPHPIPCEGCHHQPTLELPGNGRRRGGRSRPAAGRSPR